MKDFSKLYKFIKPYIKIIILAVVFMVLYGFFNALTLWSVKPAIDTIFVKTKTPSDLVSFNMHFLGIITISKTRALVLVVFLVFFSTSMRALSEFLQVFLLAYAGQKSVKDIRKKLYNNLLESSMSFYTKIKTGDMISRFTSDCTILQQFIQTTAPDFIRRPIEVVFLLCLLFMLDYKFALICFIIIPIMIYLTYRVGKRMKMRSYQAQQKIGSMAANVQEKVYGIGLVKTVATENFEKEKFEKLNEDITQNLIKVSKVQALAPVLMQMVGVVGVTMIIFIGGVSIIKGNNHFTPGSFLAFISALVYTYRPLKNLVNSYQLLQMASAAFQRILQVMENKEKEDDKGKIIFKQLKEKIEFKNICFKYNDKDYILQDFNAVIKKGEMIAFAAPTGEGKSTILNLLLKLYIPNKGEILIDNININEIEGRSLRKRIGFVMQEVILFNDTIKNNILYSRPDASDKEVYEALKTAGLYEFIMSLENKADTLIGDRGIALSGGQRQRLSLARVAIRDPEVLILDEATSALDIATEAEIWKNFERIRKNKTAIIIAHRPETILKCSKVFLLSKGRIIEQGNPKELLEKSRVFRKMYNL